MSDQSGEKVEERALGSSEGQTFRQYTGKMAIVIKVIAIAIPIYCIVYVLDIWGVHFGIVFYPAAFSR